MLKFKCRVSLVSPGQGWEKSTHLLGNTVDADNAYEATTEFRKIMNFGVQGLILTGIDVFHVNDKGERVVY